MNMATSPNNRPNRVLVTGASGFIGRYLVEFLETAGIAVRSFSRRDISRRDHVIGDVLSDVTTAAVDCDCIVHLAGDADASASYERPLDFARVNVLGTVRALEAARWNNARFILASSMRVYRPSARPITEDAPLGPVDPYGQSKAQAEQWTELYARIYGIRATTLRVFSVYGPGQVSGVSSGVVGIFFRTSREGLPLRVRARQLRDFVDVRDVARAIGLAIFNPPESYAVYNIGTGKTTSIAELGDMVRKIVGSTMPTIVDLTPGAESYVADTRRAASELGFEAQIELADGLVWYNRHINTG
ncbi:MAG TPA: NAD(P)-dependent oxidoreductase [Chloroflexota bacterium]|nr:NAD(P)-dependent oxidoreductase [Chloroflexota bacterium]